jgi:peroxiredoxin
MTSTTISLLAIGVPEIGEPAPEASVHTIDASEIALSSLWSTAERGLALVFLRHYGCPFCKEHALAIESQRADFQQAGITVAYIGCGTIDEARSFHDDLELANPVYNDPERIAYTAYGIGNATGGSLLHPKVIAGGIRAAGKGYLPRRSSGNPMQLQGQFLIDRHGIIRSVARPALMSDIPSATDLLTAACQLDTPDDRDTRRSA